MRRRFHKAARLLKVQTAVDGVAVWKVRNLEGRRRQIVRLRDDLLAVCEDGPAPAGLFGSALFSRLAHLAATDVSIRASIDAQLIECVAARARMRASENLVCAAKLELRVRKEVLECAEIAFRDVHNWA